ncbi:hypothetical protein FKP32DRAFT_1590377 [Trametes sanguinea]|nr:hypothetical protein FKP32DRAFT_1590377 [Trametes sanguinea]
MLDSPPPSPLAMYITHTRACALPIPHRASRPLHDPSSPHSPSHSPSLCSRPLSTCTFIALYALVVPRCRVDIVHRPSLVFQVRAYVTIPS